MSPHTQPANISSFHLFRTKTQSINNVMAHSPLLVNNDQSKQYNKHSWFTMWSLCYVDFGPLPDKPHTPEQAYCDQLNNVHYLGSNLYIWRDTLAPHN